ncbi:MAG: YjgP/YjgQ family permease [Ignavibacteriales bacterium]|nr:MAG: YjgP/YjgQ family permease [Ignavibacteriales bacterium]
MKPKIIDRYLTKQFLQTALFALFAFLVIFVVIDMMENLDDFIDNSVDSKIVMQYYLYFMPEIIRLMTPVAVFLSCLFVTGKLSNQNELTAIRSSGVSLYRMMLPILITSAGISIFSFYFGGYVTPLANKEKVKIEITNMKKNIPIPGYNIFFQDSETRIVSIGYFDMSSYQAHKVSIQDFSKNNPIEMVSRIDAVRMKYDTLKMNWTIFNGVKRSFTGNKEVLQRFNEEKITNLNFKPIDIKTKQQKPEEMTTSDLYDFYINQLKTGNDPTRTLIEYHSRFAFALSSLIVVFIGFPLASSKRRGGLALQFGISLLFTFIYLGFMKISQAFGKNGVLDPVFTAWSANIIFFVFAIINLLRTPK